MNLRQGYPLPDDAEINELDAGSAATPRAFSGQCGRGALQVFRGCLRRAAALRRRHKERHPPCAFRASPRCGRDKTGAESRIAWQAALALMDSEKRNRKWVAPVAWSPGNGAILAAQQLWPRASLPRSTPGSSSRLGGPAVLARCWLGVFWRSAAGYPVPTGRQKPMPAVMGEERAARRDDGGEAQRRSQTPRACPALSHPAARALQP